MKLYKLTNKDGCTYDDCQWGPGVTHSVSSKLRRKKLCTNGVIHVYTNKHLSLLLNPIHGDFQHLLLWEAEGKVITKDWGKAGVHKLTTIKKIKLQAWYRDPVRRLKVQVLFARFCASAALATAYDDAYAAYTATFAVADAAYAAARADRAAAAFAVADAAYAAARADRADDAAARAADDAAHAAHAVARATADTATYAAAYAAAHAADRADRAADDASADIDFAALANKAVKESLRKDSE